MSSSYLNGAHNFQVQNLTITNQMAGASKAFDHLHDNIAADAVHNSDERCSIPNCYPETRKAVQEDIHGWIADGDDDTEAKKIMWLTGPAGARKTAIAGSIAEVCKDEGILAASFFFSSFAGSVTRRTKRCLIATLAYCLLQHDGLQQLRALILSAIERDPSIFRKSLSAQCKVLIVKPLRDVRQLLIRSGLPKVIIIDGLDEVEAANSRQLEARLANEAEQVEILSTLLQAAHDPNFPFRILIVSRPEPVIRDFFSNRAGHLTKEVFLDDKYNPHSDISLFLKVKFGEIRRRYNLPLSWPGEDVLDVLRDKASGQFIYAATVVRFLQTAGMHPQARLECVLQAGPAHAISGATVFSSLDALYTQVLHSSPDPILSTRWLGAIHAKELSALFTRHILQDFHGQADYLLENLASLIHTPLAIEDAAADRYKFYHKSLADFLSDSQRCGPELYEAFQYGVDNFVLERMLNILVAKSTVVPLEEFEWRLFPEFFLFSLDLCLNWISVMGDWEGSLTCGDIMWWVSRVDADWDILWYIVESLFISAHKFCEHSLAGGCTLLCKRWRGDMISGCKALGWRVPNAITLLRHVMWEEADKSRDRGGGLPPIDPRWTMAFEPPTEGADMASRTTSNSSEDDYESMWSLANSLYARLPPDWLVLYKVEIREGKKPHNALRLEIGRIMDELGVEIEDIDPYAPCPSSDV